MNSYSVLPLVTTRRQSYNKIQLQAAAELERRKRAGNFAPPELWGDWLTTLFPNLFYHPFVERHEQFWQHIEAIQPGIKPPAFFAIWGRGGTKTTNAEAAAVWVGAKEVRRFALYTRSIQDKANESVANIAAMLEGKGVAKYYPQLSERLIGKYGNSKGWKVSTLRCANGFNVVALGYDAAVRGIKIEEYRPDIIFIDDIDEKGDTYETTLKKIHTLTRDILPSGSTDVAVIGIQNLVNYNGIFSQIANGKADFLRDRIVSGPFPAVEDLEWEFREDTKRYHILGGVPTWPGQSLDVCEAQMNEWGVNAFLEEAQHLITKKEGRVYHAFTEPGPDASKLDYSKITGYWHSHDFGAVNAVWGLWAKIEDKYYLIYEQQLPQGTTAARAKMIKAHFENRNIIAGYGGAKGEDQQRLDYAKEGVIIRLPVVNDVESQIDAANKMLETGTMVICSNCVHTIDQMQNCIRDVKEGIADKSTWHYLDMVRYFAAGVNVYDGLFAGPSPTMDYRG
jgi:hypothetical protein